MKNFTNSISIDYALVNKLDKDFVKEIITLLKKINNVDFFDNCTLKFISAVIHSNDVQTITYSIYEKDGKDINISFKLKNKRYVATLKNNKNDEFVSISASKFDSINSLMFSYLSDFILIIDY